jgi:hypothetical protein
LEGNDARVELRGRKARPITDVTTQPSEKKKWWCTLKIFGTKSLQEGVM